MSERGVQEEKSGPEMTQWELLAYRWKFGSG